MTQIQHGGLFIQSCSQTCPKSVKSGVFEQSFLTHRGGRGGCNVLIVKNMLEKVVMVQSKISHKTSFGLTPNLVKIQQFMTHCVIWLDHLNLKVALSHVSRLLKPKLPTSSHIFAAKAMSQNLGLRLSSVSLPYMD